MAEIPARFLFHLESDRLRRLVTQVWDRLPEHDQAVLAALVISVSDYAKMPLGSTLGLASCVAPDTMFNGCAALAAQDLSHIVYLPRAAETGSDSAVTYIIAHEFAHVVLRHTEMSVVVGNLLGFKPDPIYTKDQLHDLSDWHEDAADLQVWLWGFRDELAAFQKAYPGSRKPRWDVQLEVEGFEDVAREEAP